MSWRSPPSSSPSSPIHTPNYSLRLPPTLTLTDNPSRRLLIPSVRPIRTHTQLTLPRSPRAKQKLTRQYRPGSLQLELLPPPPPASTDASWLSKLGRFEVVHEQLELEGYQIYAVEKWVVERARLVTVVVVFTGDAQHKITVDVLRPSTALSEADGVAEFNAAVHDLRRDGARPKETAKGVIMVTSLAHFRSDLNIIAIPSGNFLASRESLFMNINLLRMGCSGRNALTLEEPSETTKEKFLQLYRIPETVTALVPFVTLVLDLVKLVQAGLALFGMYDPAVEERNGLLCDVTDNGIRRWTDEIGSPMLSLEPTERVLDPAMLSALLSLCVSIRSKLNVIGISQIVPRDPFQEPYAFLHALNIFQNTRQAVPRSASLSTSTLSQPAHLTKELITTINDIYAKSRQNEPKVKAIMHGIGDLATGGLNSLRSSGEPGATSPGTSTVALDQHSLETVAIDVFVKTVVMLPPKESLDSLRLVWTGKTVTGRRREEAEERGEVRSEEEDGFGGLLWKGPGRVGRKLESGWKGFGRSKRPGLDEDFIRPSSPSVSTPQATVPSFRINSPSGGEEDEPPTSAGETPDGSPLRSRQPSGQSSNANVSDYDRRVRKFNQTRPVNMDAWRNAVTAWSDPLALRMKVDASGAAHLEVHDVFDRDSATESELMLDERGQSEDEGKVKLAGPKDLLTKRLKRRRSFDDVPLFRNVPRMEVDRMKTDVLLCRQYYVLMGRESQMRRILSLLPFLLTPLASLNQRLSRERDECRDQLVVIEDRGHDVAAGLHKIRNADSVASTDVAMMRYRIKEVRKTGINLRDQLARLQHLARTERNRLYFPEHKEHLDHESEDEDLQLRSKTIANPALAIKCPFLRLCARVLAWIFMVCWNFLARMFFNKEEEVRPGWKKDMKDVWVNIATGMTEQDEQDDRVVQEMKFEEQTDEQPDSRERERERERRHDRKDSVEVVKTPRSQDASLPGLRQRSTTTNEASEQIVSTLGLHFSPEMRPNSTMEKIIF